MAEQGRSCAALAALSTDAEGNALQMAEQVSYVLFLLLCYELMRSGLHFKWLSRDVVAQSADAQGSALHMAEQECSYALFAALSTDAQGNALQIAEQGCRCVHGAALSDDAQGSGLQMAVRCANS